MTILWSLKAGIKFREETCGAVTVMEGLVFTEKQFERSSVLNVCKKILGNITDKCQEEMVCPIKKNF